MQSKVSVLLLFLALVVAIVPPDSFALEDFCMSWDGCVITGEYFPGEDYTVWWATCDGGYSDGGVIGGDEVPAICF